MGSESIREELRLNGQAHVGVTAVCPSYVGTGMFDGVCVPRFTRLLTPTKLAHKIVNAVRKKKENLFTPWLVKLIPFGRGAMIPVTIDFEMSPAQ